MNIATCSNIYETFGHKANEEKCRHLYKVKKHENIIYEIRDQDNGYLRKKGMRKTSEFLFLDLDSG